MHSNFLRLGGGWAQVRSLLHHYLLTLIWTLGPMERFFGGGEVVLLDYLGTNPDGFSGAIFVGVATGHKFAICFDGEFAGTVGAIALTPSEVPLTASGMLLIGALGMTALARRKRSLWIRNLRLK